MTNIEVGLTGPDWDPKPSEKYYAQQGERYAFGPTPEAAKEALLKGTLKEGSRTEVVLKAEPTKDGAEEYVQTLQDIATEGARLIAALCVGVGLPFMAYAAYWGS